MEGSVTIRGKKFKPYISEARIKARIAQLAGELNRDYRDKSPLIVVVLNGAFMFAADLVRHMEVRPEVQFIRISTYGDAMTSSNDAQLLLGLEVEVEDRDIILIEDIVETGYTVGYFMEQMKEYTPRSVNLVSLLFKPDQFKGMHKPDYVGFEIPPAFVVGYGLDYDQLGRELKGIYQLEA